MALSRYRSRTRDQDSVSSVMSGSQSPINVTHEVNSIFSAETMWDHVTGSWPKRVIVPSNANFPTRLGFPHGNPINELSVAINPLIYSCTTESEAVGTFLMSTNTGSFWTLQSGCVVGLMDHTTNINYGNQPVPDDFASMATLVATLKGQILQNATRPEYSFGEPLAEIRRTLDTMRNPLHAIRRLAKSFFTNYQVAREGARTARQTAKALASTYAEVQFGLAPAIRSVQDAVDSNVDYVLRTMFSPKLPAVRGKLTVTGVKRSQVTAPFQITDAIHSLGTWTGTTESITSITREARVGLYHSIPTTLSRGEYLGLTALDIPLTLWQTLPYSFMIDRLYNVSKFLNSCRTVVQSKVKFGSGWVIERTSTKVSRRVLKATRAGCFTNPSSTVPRIEGYFTMTRDLWIPELDDISPPPSGAGLLSSIQSTADLIALATLRLSK